MWSRSLRESIDKTTAVGRTLTGVFGPLAECERILINERFAAAREVLRARGINVGRPKAVTPDQARQVHVLHEMGESVPRWSPPSGCPGGRISDAC